MSNDLHTITGQEYEEEHGTFTSYVLGFIASIILTMAAYFAVVEQLLTGWSLVSTIVGIGIGQALVQLLLFLNLGREPKPRSNLLAFLFMIMVIIIVVGGSLWIMNNLSYNVMPSMDIQHQQGL